MPTATQQQAREAHAQQAAQAAAAALAVQRLLAAGAGWPEILTRIADFQLRAAAQAIATIATRLDRPPLVSPGPFAGVSALGYPISEPMVATIDARVPAPVEALPPPWWDDPALFNAAIAQLVASEVQDAARSAGQAEMFAQDHEFYVRILVPPSCKRCAVLAGKLYRTDVAFERHPGCDCTSEPVASLQDAMDRGLAVSPEKAFERGWIRDLTGAETQAIEDGADVTAVINSASGISTAEVAGRRLAVTKTGTTRRAAWRKNNPSLPVRLRPESIYRIAADREDSLRLLQLYGYISPENAARGGAGGRAARGGGAPPAGGGESPSPGQAGGGRGDSGGRGARGPSETPDPPDDDLSAWRARQDAIGVDFAGDVLQPWEVRTVERMLALGHEIQWIPQDRSRSTNDFIWLNHRHRIEIEMKTTQPTAEAIHGRIVDAASRAMRNHGVEKKNFIIDIESHELTDQVRDALAEFNVGRRKYRLDGLWIMTRGRLVPIDLAEA